MQTQQINENSYLFTWGDTRFFDSQENRAAFRKAPEPVFESLNPSFWVEHFGEMELHDLRDLRDKLGIKSGFAKYQIAGALVRYFANLVQNPDK